MFAAAMPESPAELDHRHLWHPFTQQRDWCEEEPLVIERGEGTDLIDAEGRRYIDGVSSLWCNVHGHRHPLIDQAMREQLDRVAHSTMLGLTHPGAAELAARLVELAPPGPRAASSTPTRARPRSRSRSRWRFSTGSSAAASIAGAPRSSRLADAYHGDTLGSVSVGGIDLFHGAYGPLLFDAHRVEPGRRASGWSACSTSAARRSRR